MSTEKRREEKRREEKNKDIEVRSQKSGVRIKASPSRARPSRDRERAVNPGRARLPRAESRGEQAVNMPSSPSPLSRLGGMLHSVLEFVRAIPRQQLRNPESRIPNPDHPSLTPDQFRRMLEEALAADPNLARRVLRPLLGTVLFPIQGGNPGNEWHLYKYNGSEVLGPAQAVELSNGNVGIGTTNPAGVFQILKGAADANHWVNISNNVGTGPGTPPASMNAGLILGWNPSGGMGESQILYGPGAGWAPHLQFGRWNGSVRTIEMTLKDGNLGIGTTDPAAPLDVNGPAAFMNGLTVRSNLSEGGQVTLNDAGVTSPGETAQSWNLDTGPSNFFRIFRGAGGLVALAVNPTTGTVGIGTGTTTPAEKLDVAGNVKAEGIIGPPRMMLSSASFSIAAGQDTESASFAAGDGVMEARTGTTVGSVDDTLGGVTDFSNLLQYEGIARNLNVSGAFLSAHARWTSDTSATNRQFYVLAGGVGNNAGVGELLWNGFGFKAEGSALKGVTILNGNPTVVDLATSISNTFLELWAVRRGSSVEFYVNGVLKGSSTSNLPTSAASTYEVQVTNGGLGGEAALQVGYLTVGFPM